ncbi:MAG TPA: TetR/AcrR family transcriptional regulator C-terminal domain-containing protein [Clostridia bacterium]|nr:TetR/AcrR family transcriptional regulator C-terminal domain-containing protein [Clostridia bacterium]
MKERKDDRRVKYTKMVLKESFINLLEKKDISKISVKEICKNADINRTTFYNHYNDQYDFMRKLENELIENVGTYLAEYTRDETDITLIDMLEKIFEYIKENAKLCRMLLREEGNLDFQKRIIMLVYNKDISSLINKNIYSREDMDYIYSFIITGCIGAIQKWLDDDMKKSTRSMAEMLIKLTTDI